jgi:hypothetical protein
MAADTDELTKPPVRVYITSESPPPPPGFVIDATVPPVPPPPEGFVPDHNGQPYREPQQVPPPPEGFLMDPDQAAMMPETFANPAVQGAITDMAKIPQRAIEGSAHDLTTMGSGEPMESVAPAVDTALSLMGTGGIAGVPVKGAETVLGAGPVRRITPAVSPPPPAGYVLDGAAKSMADDLQALRQSSVADKAEVGNTIKALPDEAKTPAMGEKLYHAAEDPAEYAKLTPEEKALSDQHLDPLRQEQFDLALEAKDLGGEDLVDDPNFMHRIAKGHAPQYDNLAGGSSYDPVTGTKGLPRTTSALQSRTFYTIESPKGVRKVISPNDNGITVWNNRTGTNVPTSAEIKPGEVVDINGTDWKVVPARTREIETHGLFKGDKGPVPAEYHKNAFVNTADAVVRLREVVRNLKFLKEVKASPWWLQHAQKVGGNRKIPEGWVRPKMPQLNDWYVDPKIAHVLDDFYKPGILDADNALRKINQFATSSMFWNPIPHMQNVGVHWAVARGWDWIKPGPLRHFATDMTRAVKATVTQDKDYQRFLRAGGGLVSGGVRNADFYGNIGRQMGMDIDKHWGAWKPLFNKLGLKTPYEAIAWWYGKMRDVLWQSSDMFMMHRYLELERKGYSTARAIKDAEKHIPNYRIPTTIMGSRTASQIAQEPALVNFARYHYGMWKSFMHMATDLAKGAKAEKVEALGNVAALAFMGYVVYPVVDAIYQKATGDPNAKLLRRGAMSVPHALAEVSRDRKSFSDFLQGNITLAPAFKEIMEQLFGHDAFTGQDFGGGAPRVEHAAQGLVAPYSDAARSYRGGEGARGAARGALDAVVGGENTSEKTEKGKQYGAMLRERAAKKHEKNPSGPIEGSYYGAKKLLGLAPDEPPKKEKKAKDPNAPKKSHHNKEKGY